MKQVTISNAQPIAPINVYIRLCLQQDQTTTDHHCWREYQDQNLLKMLLIFFFGQVQRNAIKSA